MKHRLFVYSDCICVCTGRGTVIQLQAIYATTAAQKRHEIEKVTEKIKAIEERLHENKSVKKMKLF